MTTAADPFVVNDPRLTFDPIAHVYAIGDRTLPSVTQILQAVGIADFTAPWFTADVRDRGSYVHAAILFDTEGELDEDALDPALEPYVAGWRKFRQESGAVIEHWERVVGDPILGYAGTLDGVLRTTDARGRTERTVVDVKRALYASAGPQVAAYRRCAYHLYDGPIVLKRAVLELPGDGGYRWHPLTHDHDEQVFLAALRVVNFRRVHGLAA